MEWHQIFSVLHEFAFSNDPVRQKVSSSTQQRVRVMQKGSRGTKKKKKNLASETQCCNCERQRDCAVIWEVKRKLWFEKRLKGKRVNWKGTKAVLQSAAFLLEDSLWAGEAEGYEAWYQLKKDGKRRRSTNSMACKCIKHKRENWREKLVGERQKAPIECEHIFCVGEKNQGDAPFI